MPLFGVFRCRPYQRYGGDLFVSFWPVFGALGGFFLPVLLPCFVDVLEALLAL